MKNIIKTLVIPTLIFTSCTVKKDLYIIDGSKSDGTLTLATEYDAAFRVKIDMQKAKQNASEKCKALGYKEADFFDTGVTQAIGAGRRRIIYKVQCLD
ncbi:YecR family lipoprotein [Riemerella anatipestifer]|nr:YecR family lipoprotein [Riemerella anatipestifer]